MIQNFKISDNFYLLNQKLKTEDQITIPKIKPQTNFIFAVDVSGSMSYDLPQIRKQLKNRLPSLMNQGDTISIVWFSGNEQAGILMEDVEISSLQSFSTINDSIDKWLRPIGLTAFKKPFELTFNIINNIKKSRSNGLYSLIFLSDGYNNNVSFREVLDVLKTLESELSSATFVEYGYYADSKAITEMAEVVGGEKVEAENFDKFEPIFSNKISNSTLSKKEVIKIDGEPKYNFCFSLNENNEVIVYSINENNEVLINSNLSDIYFFSNKPSGNITIKFDETNELLLKSIYSSIYVLSDRTLNSEAEYILASLGDVFIYNLFSNAYGKQKLNEFKNEVKSLISEPTKRFVKGRKDNIVIDEKAYCLLDLFSHLSQEDENLFYPYNENFKYNRIGAAKVLTGNKISDEDKVLLEDVETVEDLKVIMERLSVNFKEELKFVNIDKEKGQRFVDLVYNDERANISIRAKYNGYVELPSNKFGIEKVDTFIYRNYTIIKDGIVNVKVIPVSLAEGTFHDLQMRNVIDSDEYYEDGRIYLIDLNSIPVINKSLTKNISAKKLGELEFKLLKNKASSKVYSYYEKINFERESKDFIDIYGKEGEEYLKTHCVTSAGFLPIYKSVESEDFYKSVNLKTKLKGFSSLPKVEDVQKKLEDGKPLKASEKLLEPFVQEYLEQINSKIYLAQDEVSRKEILKKWLTTSKRQEVSSKRKLMEDISKIKFSLILSKGWFNEFSSFDENSITVENDGENFDVTFELKEEVVKI